MPNVRFNESYTPAHPPKNARPRLHHLLHDDTATHLNRAIAPISSPSDYQQRSSMQQDSMSSSVTLGHSEGQLANMRNGRCVKCTHPFGKITNKFEKITGSYYVHIAESASSHIELKPDGAPKELGPKNQALQGCIVQALACNSCSDRFAFQCVNTPSDKLTFRHRLFFKLDHISLNKDTGAVEAPHILPSLAGKGHAVPSAASPKRENTLSPSPTASNMPSVEHPDFEAARKILAKEPWDRVHTEWETRTHEAMSPSTFGKRILPVVAEIQKSDQRDYRSHSRDSSDLRPIANGRSIPQANGFTQAESTRTRHVDSMESQRADINRIDAALANVQGEMTQMRAMIAELRYEIQAGPRRPSGGATDSSTLDALSETVGRVASKAGEIDGFRFELTALKGKLRRLEDTQGIPTTPSQSTQSFPRADPALQPPPPSHRSEMIPRGWNAVNTSKRKSIANDAAIAEANKRPRSEYRAVSGERIPSYAPHVAPAPAHAPTPAPIATPTPAPLSAQPPPLTAAPVPPPTLAPIRSNSQESWYPDSQRLPSIRGMHHSGRGGNIRPQPPRIHPSQELGTPDWERDSWDQNRVDADGYYRPLGGPTGAPLSPGAAKRGNLIRRGTSGTGAPLQYIDPAPTKRTRQRPIRNEHGVLIRKDGKPDQRSISSPQNLRKVHERRMAEQERGSQGSPEDPGSPADTDAPRSAFDPLSAVGSSGEGSEMGVSPTELDSRPVSRQRDRPASRHEKVMHRMFPHGLADGAHRLNHAAHIFEPGSQEHHEAQLRGEMERKEVHARGDDERRHRMDVDDEDAPRHREEHGREQQFSGSLYGPPTQSTPNETANDKALVPDSLDPTSTTVTGDAGPAATVGSGEATPGSGPTTTTTGSGEQDSDSRPLRVRELAERNGDGGTQASGSVYEPSQTQEGEVVGSTGGS